MPELPILLSFIIAAFVVVIVPGVTVSAIVSVSLARGMAAGFWTELGVQLGRLSMVIIVAVALQAVLGVVSAAFDVIKYVGAAYLVWLGWGYLTQRHTVDLQRTRGETTAWKQILSGFVILWGNPKALIFFGAFLPQFVNPAFPAWPQVIVLGLIEMGAGLLTDGAYIVIAAKARDALTGKRAELVNRVAGVILILAAVWLALQQH